MKTLLGIIALAFLVYVVGLPRALVAIEALDHAAKAALSDAEQALEDVRAARAARGRGNQ